MTDSSTTPDAPATLKPGDALGPYRIASQLGVGDVSASWRATDTASGQDVVVRQLIPGSPVAREKSFLERCRAEVQTQQALPEAVRRVVPLKALIDDPRGAFVVTDFVEGTSIEQLLSTRPDPFDLLRGLRIIHAIAKALDQLHEQGVIHGGLRTSNLIVNADAGVHVCDVGVTRLIAEQEALDPAAARYMAPELFQAEPPDAQSDIYSLGMIAYEVLAGRGAFEEVFAAVLGDKRGSTMRWMKWHTNPRAVAPPLKQLNPRVPDKLSDLVARMMAKERTQRIASADLLLEAIHRHFGKDAVAKAESAAGASKPSTAPTQTTGPGDTAALPPRSNKQMILAVAAIIVLVVAGGVWLTKSTIDRNAYEQRRGFAADALVDADRAYQAGRFDDALSLYQAQAQDWPERGDPLGKHGRAGALLAQLQLDLASGELASARDRLIELESLGEAGPADRAAVRALSDELDRRDEFQKIVEKIQAHLEAGEFAQARTTARDVQGGGLTENESVTLMELQVRIGAQLTTEQVDAALGRADELFAQGNIAGAIDHLNDVSGRLQSPRLADKIKALQLEQSFLEAVERSESAQRDNDYDGAVEALALALSLKEDDGLARRLLVLKSAAAVERGRVLAESGDESGASEQFTESLGYDPDNAEAKGWLARMNVTLEKRSHVEAGRRAEATGDLARAAGHYREALKSGPDESVESALRRVETAALLARVDQLIRSGQLDSAAEVLDEARRLEPDNPLVEEAFERHDRHVRYRTFLEQGDSFVEQGRYAQATQAFVKARKVMDNDEISKRLDDTEYSHLLAQARGFIANEQWTSARGILDTAAGIRITDDLTQMRDQVADVLAQEAATGGDDADE